MTHWIMTLSQRLDGLISIPRFQVLKERPDSRKISSDLHSNVITHHMHVPHIHRDIHTNKQTNRIKPFTRTPQFFKNIFAKLKENSP